MLRTTGIRHCLFLHTDYSLPVSLCPHRGLLFLSRNDVISLHSFIYTQLNHRQGSEKLLARESCFM